MKYKKYLIFAVFMIFFGIDNIFADKCFYQTNEASLSYDSTVGNFRIEERGSNYDPAFKSDPLINNGQSKVDSSTGITVNAINGGCPAYIVYRHRSYALWFDSDGIWGFNDYSSAKTFADASSQIDNMGVWIVNKKDISETEFNANLKRNKNNNYSSASNKPAVINGEETDVGCDELFGSKNDPNSIAYLVNEILLYPKYVIPILLVLYGTLDFFKAVIAGKEDEMKKAQMTFIKRVVIGVAIFLIPVIMNVLMWLADIVWEGLGYTSCSI